MVTTARKWRDEMSEGHAQRNRACISHRWVFQTTKAFRESGKFCCSCDEHSVDLFAASSVADLVGLNVELKCVILVT